MAKDSPPPMFPWYIRWAWSAWEFVTWPHTARTLKRHGFTRTGFMTWELGPEDEHG